MTKQLVLVTGASGFIGSHAVKAALEAGYRVRGTVRKTTGPKVEHLVAMGSDVELVSADLTSADGWDDAVKGCDYVLHLASPFVLNVDEKDADSLIKPAVDGTMHVLRAAARCSSVKRVVLTSSIVSIYAGWADPPKNGDVITEPEAKWGVPEGADPYPRSKIMAEKVAWDFVNERKAAGEPCFELATILPGFVIGPTLSSNTATSFDLAQKLLGREMPAVPALALQFVDVRDVAKAHVLAMSKPEAAGQRIMLSAETIWMRDMAVAANDVFRPLGYCVPTGRMPKIILRLASCFDKSLRVMVPLVNTAVTYDNSKSRTVLGLQYGDSRKAFIDMCHSLIQVGIIQKTSKYEAYEKEHPEVAKTAA